MFDWYFLSLILAILGWFVAFYLFTKLFVQTIVLNNTSGTRELGREFYLEWIFLNKLIPKSTVKQRQRVQWSVLMVFLLCVGESFCWVSVWKWDEPGWQSFELIFVSIASGIMLTVGVLALYSVIVQRRIEEKLIAVQIFRARDVSFAIPWHFAITWLVLLPNLMISSLSDLSYSELLDSPVSLLLLIFIPSLIWLSQKNYLCADGICAGFSFFTWDEIAWCRWYPDRRGVMIGVNENSAFESWFVVAFSDLFRARYLPLLEDKLAGKELESVAEVLGLEDRNDPALQSSLSTGSPSLDSEAISSSS